MLVVLSVWLVYAILAISGGCLGALPCLLLYWCLRPS